MDLSVVLKVLVTLVVYITLSDADENTTTNIETITEISLENISATEISASMDFAQENTTIKDDLATTAIPLENTTVKDDLATTAIPLECRIDLNKHLKQNSRLILHPHSGSTDGYRFLLPTVGQGSITLQNMQEVVFACPGGLFERAWCVSGATFQFSSPDRQLNISDITCRRPLRPTVRNQGKCYNNEYNYLGVGITLRTDPTTFDFVKLMDFCFNPKKHISSYAKFTLMQGVENGQKNVKRPNFTCSPFFGNLSHSLDEVYGRRSQYGRLLHLLGSREHVDKYINRSMSSDLFLARGHLVAFKDFTYFSEQQATTMCVNTAPMWQIIRKGNWRNLENSIRQYARNKGIDLIVYAGTYDVLHLPDANGSYVPVTLSAGVPVPELFWKLVYDRLMRQGIVFILINNHDSELELVQYEVCDDVCDKTEFWFTSWDRTQATTGYVYCCTVPDFLEATNAIPEFRDVVTGLLT